MPAPSDGYSFSNAVVIAVDGREGCVGRGGGEEAPRPSSRFIVGEMRRRFRSRMPF